MDVAYGSLVGQRENGLTLSHVYATRNARNRNLDDADGWGGVDVD